MKGRTSLIPLFAGLTLTAAGANPENHPLNVVFILADDLGISDTGCYGSTFYETPRIDALAAEGVRFTDAYAACPVSSPTRASILTGASPARLQLTDWIPGRQARPHLNAAYPLLPPEFRHDLPLSQTTLAEALRESGYRTLFVGKWHLGEGAGSNPRLHGFDTNVGGGRFGHPPEGYFSPYGLPELEEGPQGEYLTARLADECVKLLEEQTAAQPFLLFFSLYQVHTPLQAEPDRIARFQDKAARSGITTANSTTTDREWIDRIPVEGRFVVRTRQGHPVYAAMVAHMDRAVGKVIDALRRLGIYDRTIIVFTSDNGGLATSEGSPTSNAPYRAGKGWPYEGGVRVPLIVRWPGVTRPGTTNTTVVTSTDFYPTLLELTGSRLRPEQHVDGMSFAPALQSGSQTERGPVFWHYPHYSNQGGRPFGTVRDGSFKLIEHYEAMRTELFDLAEDPSETTDLSNRYPERTQALGKLLDEWRRSVGAKMPFKKSELP